MNVKIKLSECLRPLVLGALFLGTAAAHAAVQPLDKVVAIVDNDVIMQSQLDQRVHEVQQTIAKRGQGVPPASVLDQQVLERLIVENLQLQIGERSGIRITDEELNQAIGTIAQRNNMTLDQFRQALAHDGLSYDDAREQVRREMIISRVRQRRVAERIQVTDQEVKNFLASDLGKAQLSEEYHLANILVPTSDSASSSEVQAAAQKAEDLYKQLKQGADFAQMAIARSGSDTALDGGDMGWRKAGQLPPPFDRMLSSMPTGDITPPVRTPGGFIILKLLDKRGGQTVMVDEVHVRHILIKPSEIRTEAQTKELAQKIYDRIQSGEDFATLAKTYSEDPGSALNGGDLNWIDPNALVPEFREVMAETPQGVLSKPFRTQYGWHVLEVLGRRSTDSTTQAREQVRREMIISRVRQRRVAERIQVTDQEVKNFLASDLGKAQLSEEYHLANILIPTSDSASSSEVQAAAQKAEDLYKQLKQGADFAQLAIARSGSDTALDGGDMGWRKAGQLPPPFDRMLSSMPTGDITPPVRTPGGFIILKLLDKRGGQTVMVDEVHVRHILIKPSEIRTEAQTKELAQKIYDRIQSGEDFATLAKTYSEDPGSALNGGDLNWIDPNALVPEFREVMAETPQGVLSKPFRTQYGWHVLEVLGRRSTDSTTQAREQQAMNALRNRKYDEELQSWLRQIRDEAYVEIKLPGATNQAESADPAQ